jgi:hypothetical protein
MATGAIKVNRTLLISKLEVAKADLEKKQARLEQINSDFDVELTKWREGATKHIVEVSNQRYGNTYEAKISDAYLAKYPKKKPFDPKDPNVVEPSWAIKQDIKSLSESLIMLKLSEEQTVSQTLLRNLAQYLA